MAAVFGLARGGRFLASCSRTKALRLDTGGLRTEYTQPHATERSVFVKYAPRKRRPTLLAVRWRDKARRHPTFIQVCFTRGVPFVGNTAGVKDGPEEICWWSGADLRNGGGPSASRRVPSPPERGCHRRTWLALMDKQTCYSIGNGRFARSGGVQQLSVATSE